MNKLLYILLFCWCGFLSVSAQTTLEVEVQNGSKITINGDASIVKFKIYQNADNFLKRNYIIAAYRTQNRIYLDNNEINIPVRSFTSNNRMALKDFLRMMEPDKYKSLDIQLNYIELPTDLNSDLAGKAVMDFTIKGITKKYTIPIYSSKEGNSYVFNSKKQINIKDFGLVAPNAMMGLIKVNDVIDVGLHFILKIESLQQAQLLKSD
ncbi:YceI family protein [uncultured Paludibacter sp.]|uniref:YceI family protein n=1 Tax=uncultured Paludibacter sp. TaxID=497635 RepID=A0A653AHE2_9BACT|nr:YceI family protein [uncultured Paludibacter sp.]